MSRKRKLPTWRRRRRGTVPSPHSQGMAGPEPPPHIFDRALMRSGARALASRSFPISSIRPPGRDRRPAGPDAAQLRARPGARRGGRSAGAVMAGRASSAVSSPPTGSPRGPAGPVDVVLDEEALPFAPASLDAVIAGPGSSSSTTCRAPWRRSPRAQARRAVPRGAVRRRDAVELRASWFAAETEVTAG
jgi:hypothetical protein